MWLGRPAEEIQHLPNIASPMWSGDSESITAQLLPNFYAKDFDYNVARKDFIWIAILHFDLMTSASQRLEKL